MLVTLALWAGALVAVWVARFAYRRTDMSRSRYRDHIIRPIGVGLGSVLGAVQGYGWTQDLLLRGVPIVVMVGSAMMFVEIYWRLRDRAMRRRANEYATRLGLPPIGED